MSVEPPPVCDYEGSAYSTEFWGGDQRNYEDQVERIAMRRLLPSGGQRVLEVGAGFGRLTDELAGYREVVLHDYSRSMLQEARARLGDGEGGHRYRYVASDVYRLPFAPGVFDGATMIRVIHHIADAPAALAQVRAALAEGAIFILEYANKRNFKAIARYLLRKQSWNPFSPDPIEFIALNFNFHPKMMRQTVQNAEFSINRQLTVSHFRIARLKQAVPTHILVALERPIQRTGAWWQFSPSVFMQLQATGTAPTPPTLPTSIFKCPACGCLEMHETAAALDCPDCGRRYHIRDGIYDFKEPDLS